ncbi:MAG: hypothetical protein KJO56_13095 [Gammaproteobacteria bacterium]|nr:hypothetical protein [Gammaproteobacteria bacterium]MBT8104221.1 hypothetical protein [Gammaproteobacteria bacterium]NNF49060.1 hypothetical protein [Woeseiaceae bacterium]NNK24236.1 hypothetical protein [Woeseiaceae bacterium]NNL63877.1 hypothetical protein [Woeseiaceae bacterium]
MGSKTAISPLVRAICGVLGVCGVAALAFNAFREGGIEPGFGLFGGVFGGFVFLYAALFGSLPWGGSPERDGDKGKMSRSKWQMFWAAFVVFLVLATYYLSEKGVFELHSLVVLSIVGVSFGIVGIALYFFIRDRPDHLP